MGYQKNFKKMFSKNLRPFFLGYFQFVFSIFSPFEYNLHKLVLQAMGFAAATMIFSSLL
jgi:hypothetical protein